MAVKFRNLLVMNLTNHFTLNEFIISETAVRKGIDNTPSETVIINLKELCSNLLEPIREKLNAPIHVSSGYRCKKLNTAIGGAKNSQHIEGKAADITTKELTVEELFQFVCDNFDFDQCIQEFDSWVHVSWNGDKNRNQKLRAIKEKKDNALVTRYIQV